VSYKGTVQNGVVVLPPDIKLPDGTQVEVQPLDLLPDDDPFLQTIQKVAKPRPHWPKDFALNHGHCMRGNAKQRH
jgi:hypothetical protein